MNAAMDVDLLAKLLAASALMNIVSAVALILVSVKLDRMAELLRSVVGDHKRHASELQSLRTSRHNHATHISTLLAWKGIETNKGSAL